MQKPPHCFPQWLHQFYIPFTVHKGFPFLLILLILSVCASGEYDHRNEFQRLLHGNGLLAPVLRNIISSLMQWWQQRRKTRIQDHKEWGLEACFPIVPYSHHSLLQHNKSNNTPTTKVKFKCQFRRDFAPSNTYFTNINSYLCLKVLIFYTKM